MTAPKRLTAQGKTLTGVALAMGLALAPLIAPAPVAAQSLGQLNEQMLSEMQSVRGVSSRAMARVREIFAASSWIGQGNPAVTRHPLTPEQAAQRLGGSVDSVRRQYRNARFERICGHPYEVPLYDPATQRPEDATVCAFMFEYPNVPLAYPVVWVRANEAAALCAAEGARIGDAHEWEGAAAGALLEPDYAFHLGSPQAMRSWHNQRHAGERGVYSIGQWRSGVCATGSSKTASCNGGSFTGCGSDTYPAGSFPQCHSPLGVYDIDGNAAEHMNLPLNESQMASRGSTTLGVTEMKGSWFIWDQVRAHEHWARWRAPFWHGSRVLSGSSHRNYHLGFRCFRDVR
ncbi:SUMF1/EgtB/PvdO family nonheme iron enzyme [Pararhodobacter oceanensis]|uniref:SUMF1/EgtB/PvdO family nonheme iron enzyme n=1 Tax=Pararhodobacter oceanensis TaxID=2172121 RepID=UPI003A8F24C2